MGRRSSREESLAAFEAVYREHFGRYLRVALAILGSPEAAADAVQEGFARAIGSREQFRGEGSLEAWVWRGVVNVALTDRRYRVETVEPNNSEEQSVQEGGEMLLGELRTSVAGLPKRQRLVLFLRHYADLTYEQIAEVLDVERGTVAATLHAAHAALRRSLTEVTK